MTTITEKPVTFDELLPALKRAAIMTKVKKPYARGLDDWDLINSAWEHITTKNIKLTRKFLFWSCYCAMARYLEKKFKLYSTTYNLSLVFLDTNIGNMSDAQRQFLEPEDLHGRSNPLSDRVHEAIRKAKLTPGQQQVIQLFYFEDRSLKEVMEITGRGRGAVGMSLTYTRRKLKPFLLYEL